jgi:hypothetical protein
MHTDKSEEESLAEAQRRKENNSAPLRLCVSSSLMHFICVDLIYICGKNAFLRGLSVLRGE